MNNLLELQHLYKHRLQTPKLLDPGQIDNLTDQTTSLLNFATSLYIPILVEDRILGRMVVNETQSKLADTQTKGRGCRVVDGTSKTTDKIEEEIDALISANVHSILCVVSDTSSPPLATGLRRSPTKYILGHVLPLAHIINEKLQDKPKIKQIAKVAANTMSGSFTDESLRAKIKKQGWSNQIPVEMSDVAWELASCGIALYDIQSSEYFLTPVFREAARQLSKAR